MVSLARKLTRLLPAVPRKRYNIFAGTNSMREWLQMVHVWLFGERYDDLDIIAAYEQEFAKRCDAKHGISFGAGRMALYAILDALGIGEGDEVIIPAFTCEVVPNAILYRKARPVYVDIEPRHFNIDVAKVETAITPRTKALYAQHTFGLPCNVEFLREVGRRHGLPVIEDAAHALGAEYRGKRVGSLTEVAFFSTDHSKVINTHLGGIAVTNDDGIAARLRKVQTEAPFLDGKKTRRLIRSFLLEYLYFSPNALWIGRSIHALLTRLGLLFFFLDELKTTKSTEYPYPCRLSAAQAKLGLLQLTTLDWNLAHRRKIVEQLEKKIAWNGMDLNDINKQTWLRYSFLVRDREKFEVVFDKHFDLGVWFTSVLSGRTEKLDAVGYQSGSCPVAEYVAQHIVNFPTHMRIPLEIIQSEVERNWSWLKDEIDYSERQAPHV